MTERDVMEDDLKSTKSADQYKSSVIEEYEKLQNISRPVSPINLIVSSRPSQPETAPEVSSSTFNLSQALLDDNYSQVSSVLSIRGTNKSLQSDHLISQRKGKPPTCNALVAVPNTIRLKSHNNALVEDHNLMVVSKMNTARQNTSPVTLPTLELPLYTQPLGRPTLSKSLTKPALGYVEPKGEMKRTQNHLFNERRKMHRYNYGVSPLERISRIEHDLVDVLTARKKKTSSSSPNFQMSSQASSNHFHLNPPTPTGQPNVRPPMSPSSTTSSNHITIEVSLSSTSPPQPDSASYRPNLMSPNSKVASNYLLPMNSALSVFSDVQSIGGNSSHSGSGSQLNFHHAGKYLNNPETYSQQKARQILTHELSRPSPKEDEKNKNKSNTGNSALLPSPFSQAMNSSNRPKRDPTSYLVKDHRPDSPDYQLYRLEGETTNQTSGRDKDNTTPSFDFLKQKILSTKDKVYDCGPEYYQKLYSDGEHKKILDPTQDDPIHGITKLHKFSTIEIEEGLSNAKMPSRYQDGKTSLVERKLDPKNSQKGYIKLKEDREIEIKTRVPCVSCLVEASLWCAECKFSYCANCWNAVPHHEFVHPDEVWRNRLPKNSIEKCDHSVTGLQVHITPDGLVSQGLYSKKKIKITRSRRISTLPSPGRGFGGHRLSDFPSTDSIMEKGFNHAENWADLEDERSYTSEGAAGHGLTGLQKAEKNDLKITLPETEFGHNIDGPPIDSLPDSPMHPVDITDENIFDENEDIPKHIDEYIEENSLENSEVEQLLPPHDIEIIHTDNPTPTNLLSTNKSYLPPRQHSPSYAQEPSERAKSPKNLMWQVSSGTKKGTGLTTVNRIKPSPQWKQMKGITKQFTPQDWKDQNDSDTNTSNSLEFTIHRGVSVATIRK